MLGASVLLQGCGMGPGRKSPASPKASQPSGETDELQRLRELRRAGSSRCRAGRHPGSRSETSGARDGAGRSVPADPRLSRPGPRAGRRWGLALTLGAARRRRRSQAVVIHPAPLGPREARSGGEARPRRFASRGARGGQDEGDAAGKRRRAPPSPPSLHPAACPQPRGVPGPRALQCS